MNEVKESMRAEAQLVEVRSMANLVKYAMAKEKALIEKLISADLDEVQRLQGAIAEVRKLIKLLRAEG